MGMVMEKQDTPAAEPFMAFVRDDITARALRDIAHKRDWDAQRIYDAGADLALKMLKEVSTPALMVIDLSGQDDPLQVIEGLADVCEPGVRLICLGTLNDVGLYRDLLEMGVEDYLLKPIDPENLDHAIDRVLEVKTPQPKAEEAFEGKVVSFTGTHGGVGCSSLALNFAWDMSERFGKKVALVDMDLHFGTLSLSLDLEPAKGFREALENPSRIDSLFLDRVMVKVTERLNLLASETDFAIPCHFEANGVELLLERLRQKYDVVVLDVPRFLIADLGDLLTRMGSLNVISDLSLLGMRDSLRFLIYCRDHQKGAEIRLIGNRVGENKDRELSQKEFENGIEAPLDSLVNFDPKCFAKAETQGAALLKIQPQSKVAVQMKDLFDRFVDEPAQVQTKPSLIKRILGLK